MFNVAIINIRDIGKYIIKGLIIITILFTTSSIISKESNTAKEIENTGKKIINYTFLECLNICIPGIKQIELKTSETSPIEKILNSELSIAKHVKQLDDSTIIEEKTEENVKENNKSEEASIPENVKTQVLETNVKERYTNRYGSVNIKNETDFSLTEEMLTPDSVINNPKKVLIYHTHTCESYTPSESFPYEMTGNYRTTDLNFNVARVGTELKNYLEKNGYTVIHDTTYHDSPAYSGSYDRSYITAENRLKESPDTEIVFDIHRDSIGDSTYAPTVKIGEEYAAQLMFVIGTNGGRIRAPKLGTKFKNSN